MTARRLIAAAALAFLGTLAAQAQNAALAVGQVWSVKDRPTVEVTIGYLAPDGASQAVHVSIAGIPVPGSTPEAPQMIAINHMAFKEEAFRRSADRVLRTDGTTGDDFAVAYQTWAAKGSGLFTISLGDAVDLVVDQYEKATSRPQ